MNINGLNISIIGAVRSGVAAARLCIRQGAVPFVSDYSSAEKILPSVEAMDKAGIVYETGGHTERVYLCDLMVTSPGVPSDSPVLTEAKNRGIKVISELEFASWFYKGTIIGITGTNGKTTTTTLTAYLLEKCGKKVFTAGNIGYAFSEIADTASADSYVALEISSFQLDYIDTFKPKYSMILNITPDHLDRYQNSFSLYSKAKFDITRNQDDKDYFIYNADDENIKLDSISKLPNKLEFSTKHKVAEGAYFDGENLISVSAGKETVLIKAELMSLKGEHNIYNVLSVLAVLNKIGVDNNCISEALKTFPGVEHRLEFVRELNGVEFINDSKATNVDSVWYALRSFSKPLLLILGGKDKGNDYDRIREPVLKNVRKIYAIGSSKEKVYNYFNPLLPVEKVETLEDCVIKAKDDAKQGEIVLLSPACASFDMFSSYEHRGKVFKQAVEKL